MPFFFSALLHCGSGTKLSPRAALILQRVTFTSSSPVVLLESAGLLCQEASGGCRVTSALCETGRQEKGCSEQGCSNCFHLLSLLLWTISCALLGKSHLAEAFLAFQALELAVHMSPLYVTVHTRIHFFLFSFVCVTGLTQPLQGLLSFTFQVQTSESSGSPQCPGPGAHPGIADPVCILCLQQSHGDKAQSSSWVSGSTSTASEATNSYGADWPLGDTAKWVSSMNCFTYLFNRRVILICSINRWYFLQHELLSIESCYQFMLDPSTLKSSR